MASSVFVVLGSPAATLSRLTLEVAAGDAIPASQVFLPTLLIAGNLTTSAFIEMHNRHAVGADLYTHNDAAFKAPYMNLYKSRGSQTAPTAVTMTGYELDSIGGINFGGYNGTAYEVGAAIYSQTDEDWSTGGSHHGAHLSIYGSSIGGPNVNQIIQFGGLDPADTNAHNTSGVSSNIISYRAISFNGNSVNNPCLVPTSSPPVVKVRTASNSADAGLTCGALTASGTTTLSGGAVSYGANDSAGAGFRLVRVPN